MQYLLTLAVLVMVAKTVVGFGFGAAGGAAAAPACGCAPPAPVCAPPPPPVCAPPPIQNACCAPPPPPAVPRCGCRTKRRVTEHKRVSRDTTHVITQISNTTDEDPKCNNEKLRDIILSNLSKDAESSKLAIHELANNKLGGHYAVICAEKPFSYIADSHSYCLEGNANIYCYAFQI